MPAVCEALIRIAADRPANPLRLMGEHLIKEAQKVRCTAGRHKTGDQGASRLGCPLISTETVLEQCQPASTGTLGMKWPLWVTIVHYFFCTGIFLFFC